MAHLCSAFGVLTKMLCRFSVLFALVSADVGFTKPQYFLECGKSYVSCTPVEIPQGQNPYLEAVKKSPWMRQTSVGYLQVRPGVNLFYQLYYAGGTKEGAFNKPLIIWIQGGPGFAATGVANFAEIGPLDMDFKPRNHTWVRKRNVLLIDHPVGAGFSYAINDTLFAKTDREMTMDLTRAIKLFLRRRKEFRKTPTYLVGQSYGGKLCPRLAVYLLKAIKNKGLKMNLKGIGIGGGWVNPRESILMTVDFLYHTGTIDRSLFLEAKNKSLELVRLIDRQDYTQAVDLDTQLFNILNQGDADINFNNVYKFSPYMALDHLNRKVNKYVKPTYRIVDQALEWSYLSTNAYDVLRKNFVVPSHGFLEKILDTSNLQVVIYNGNYDVVTPVAGASNWVHKLNWYGTKNFAKAKTREIRGFRNGHYKEWKQLSFWTVFGAGHWVPEDNPEAMEHILDHMTGVDLPENLSHILLSHRSTP